MIETINGKGIYCFKETFHCPYKVTWKGDIAVIDLNLDLNKEMIEKIKVEATEMIKEIMLPDLIQVILYGSCMRGDYRADSDVDIALLTKCNRYEAKKYDKELAKIATELAMKYFAVVNFVSLPYDEFLEKKTWYSYFRSIDIGNC